MTKRTLVWLVFASVVLSMTFYAHSAASISYQAPETVYAATEDVNATTTEAETVLIETKPQKPSDVKGLIEWYADINGAPQDQSYWIAQCESELQNVPNTGGGTYGKGIYQFVQSTFDALCEGDVWDVEDNINCGTKLIAEGKLSHWQPYSGHCWLPHVSL